MKVVFYKNGTALSDRLIRWWTHSPYSHCELLFDDGLMVSSYPHIGIRELHVGSLDPHFWDILDIPLDAEKTDHLKTWCKGELGCPYDWASLFMSQVLKIPRAHPDKWYCSEFCAAGLQQADQLHNVLPCTLSPGRLFDLIVSDLETWKTT